MRASVSTPQGVLFFTFVKLIECRLKRIRATVSGMLLNTEKNTRTIEYLDKSGKGSIKPIRILSKRSMKTNGSETARLSRFSNSENLTFDLKFLKIPAKSKWRRLMFRIIAELIRYEIEIPTKTEIIKLVPTK